MDKYDEAIAHFRKHPELLMEAWKRPNKCEGGCLFQKATRSGLGHFRGCLTEVRRWHQMTADTDELTAAIRADRRIPMDPNDITVEILPVFAEWQRKLDRELRNVMA